MYWRRKEKKAAEMYERLIKSSSDEYRKNRVPKGCIPVLVGSGASMERFVVHVRVLKQPCIMELLDMTAEEFGYGQRGILRIPCDADHFRQIINGVSHPK